MVGRRKHSKSSSKSNNVASEQVKAVDDVPILAIKEEKSSPHEEKRPTTDDENNLNSSVAEVANNKNCDRPKENVDLSDAEKEPGEIVKKSEANSKGSSNFKIKRRFTSRLEGSRSRSRSPSPAKKTHRKKRHSSTTSSSSEDEKETFSSSRSKSKRSNRDSDGVEAKVSEVNSKKMDSPLSNEKLPARPIDDECAMENSESLSREVESEKTPEKEVKPRSKKIHTRKLSLSGSKESEKEDSTEGKVPRKRKWGALTKSVPKALPSISTESLKDLIPDYKPSASSTLSIVENPHSEVLPIDEDPIVEERVHVVVNVSSPKHHSSNVTFLPDVVEKHKVIHVPIREEILPPSPPKNPTTCIIHVRNLVRPFTLHQLKDELGKTGTLVENGFWIDKIKSKCYVTYETEEQAAATRQALHGARWPVSNPKTLTVDFSTKEELEFHKERGDAPAVPKIEMMMEVQKDARHTNQEMHPMPEQQRRPSEKEERSRKREREKERIREMPIREWDRDKLTQEMPTNDEKGKDRGRERERDRDGARGPRDRREKVEKKESSKKKHEEETPAKLLDDLFRKTKATPCIYWLPLTEEQREEAKKHRDEEREKRRQRISQEEKDLQETTDRRPRVRERENRPVRDRDASRRSRSRSRSPGRRR